VTNVPAGLANVAGLSAGEDYSLVLVAPGPPQFGPRRESVVAHLGSETILNPTVLGTHPVTFQWFHDGVAVSGATNRNLLLIATQPADAGDYVLVATNPEVKRPTSR